MSFSETELHICSPLDDDMKAIKSIYHQRFKKNIFYHGFVKPGSKEFEKLMSECSYSILYSSAEGCCTSIIATMKCGLVPIINYECGLYVFNPELLIKSGKNKIKNVIDSINKVLSFDENIYTELVDETLKESQKYGEQEYSNSFKSALVRFEQRNLLKN